MKNIFFKGMYVAVFAMLLLLLSVSSCKKYLEIDPPTNSILWQEPLTSQNVVDKVVNYTYGQFGNSLNKYGIVPESFELMTDNYTTASPSAELTAAKNNMITPESIFLVEAAWQDMYKTIYSTNKMLEVLPTAVVSTQLTQEGINQAMVDAYTLRAVSYFYLGRMFGNVPLCLTSDVDVNNTLGQATQDEVFAQVEKDLLAAKALAVTAKPSEAIYFRSQNQISSLLAKLYLHWGKWTQASAAASDVIASSDYAPTTIADAYYRPSSEIITAIGFTTDQNTGTQLQRTEFFSMFAPYSANNAKNAGTPTTDLLNSYPESDLRRSTWFGTVYSKLLQVKYPYSIIASTVPEGKEQDAVLSTLPEMYLIRAEAKANLDDLPGAAADVLVVRERAGLGAIPVVDKPTMLTTVLNERRWELNPSLGERWFDLCRTDNLVPILGDATKFPNKAPNIKTTSKLLPIPKSQILMNSHLIQNPGYN